MPQGPRASLCLPVTQGISAGVRVNVGECRYVWADADVGVCTAVYRRGGMQV